MHILNKFVSGYLNPLVIGLVLSIAGGRALPVVESAEDRDWTAGRFWGMVRALESAGIVTACAIQQVAAAARQRSGFVCRELQ